jgi:hypothetical protein
MTTVICYAALPPAKAPKAAPRIDGPGASFSVTGSFPLALVAYDQRCLIAWLSLQLRMLRDPFIREKFTREHTATRKAGHGVFPPPPKRPISDRGFNIGDLYLAGMSQRCHEQTSSALFDHLVGGRQQRWRHIASTNRSRLTRHR